MKHEPVATANAVAVTTATIYAACRLLVGLFPELMFSVGQSWLHGIELTRLGSWNLTMGNFIYGVVSATVFAWLVGYIFCQHL